MKSYHITKDFVQLIAVWWESIWIGYFFIAHPVNDPFLECCSRVGYYDVKRILKYEKMKKQNEEEKNRLFFYDSYDLDSRHGESPILARYKNIKIFFKFNKQNA